MNWLSFITTTITMVFAGFVLQRYRKRGGPHLLIWGIGLLMYAVGTYAEFALSIGWSDFWLHAWYVTGALLTAAWLGQGTVYLLVRKPKWLAHALLVVLTFGSLYATFRTFITPLDATHFNAAIAISEQYRKIMPPGGVRSLTIPFNIYGTICLIGGALYSAWLFWRKRVLPNRVVGNILIAAGGLMPALGGTLTRLGSSQFLYLSELLGVVLMFGGFLAVMTTRASHKPAAISQTAA